MRTPADARVRDRAFVTALYITFSQGGATSRIDEGPSQQELDLGVRAP